VECKPSSDVGTWLGVPEDWCAEHGKSCLRRQSAVLDTLV